MRAIGYPALDMDSNPGTPGIMETPRSAYAVFAPPSDMLAVEGEGWRVVRLSADRSPFPRLRLFP